MCRFFPSIILMTLTVTEQGLGLQKGWAAVRATIGLRCDVCSRMSELKGYSPSKTPLLSFFHSQQQKARREPEIVHYYY